MPCHYAFGNLLSAEESRRVYAGDAVPGPDHVLFQAGLATFNPHAATAADFANDERAPLLLIAGGKDHTAPASLTKANFTLSRKSRAFTDWRSSPSARTTHPASPAGRKSPTTRCSGTESQEPAEPDD